MQRIKDTVFDTIEPVVDFRNKTVLEIGCGIGSRSGQLASRCGFLTAIEPDEKSLQIARALNIPNASFQNGLAEALEFDDHTFDIVFFTLSFHHVAKEKMMAAIDEAMRVLKKEGVVIFLEPTHDGTFFEAEIKFDACDGDERKEKDAAYNAITTNEHIVVVKEIVDETAFHFESVDDFMQSMQPKRNHEEIELFLTERDFVLTAYLRIIIAAVTNSCQ